MDTPWTNFRWWLATRFLNAAVRVAPDGTAACDLEDILIEWANRCRKAWAQRYPQNHAH